MRTIGLTLGKTALVDDADYERVAGIRWHAVRSKYTYYATTRIADRTIYMHRFILAAPAGVNVDHANGDGLDNQRENLRLCTQTQNLQNARRLRGGLSRFKGVSRTSIATRGAKPWRAYIQVNHRYVHLGHYDAEEDAARAYNAAALHHFGQFAAVNEGIE